MWSCHRTGKAVWETRRPFSFLVSWQRYGTPETASRHPRGRPAVRLAAALLARRIPFFHARKNFRRRGIGRAGIERRRRIVFEPQLDRLRGLSIEQDRHQRQRKIDTRGDTAAGDAVAVDAYAGLGRRR